jgi:thiosulfate/3-mercaptopyruvate sulfurtransferase
MATPGIRPAARPQWPGADLHVGDALPAADNNPLIEALDAQVAPDDGHIPGAVCWVWTGNVLQSSVRDILGKTALETQLSQAGIAQDTTVVLYDGLGNLLAAMALWMLKICRGAGRERVGR